MFCGFWLFQTVIIYCTLSIVKGLHLYSVVQAWNYSCCQHQHSVNRQCTKKSVITIGHFWVPLCICFKTKSPCKTFHTKMTLICMKMNLTGRTHFHMNGSALTCRLVLKSTLQYDLLRNSNPQYFQLGGALSNLNVLFLLDILWFG